MNFAYTLESLFKKVQATGVNLMQISRHWRLNAQRYRLEGVRYPNGYVTLQGRPIQAQPSSLDDGSQAREERQIAKDTVVTAA